MKSFYKLLITACFLLPLFSCGDKDNDPKDPNEPGYDNSGNYHPGNSNNPNDSDNPGNSNNPNDSYDPGNSNGQGDSNGDNNGNGNNSSDNNQDDNGSSSGKSPLNLVLYDGATLEPLKATLSGKISGANKLVEVGVLYGRNSNLNEITGKKKTTWTDSDFSVTIDGLMDEQTYYIRSYYVWNDIPYYGEIKTIQSGPITYTLYDHTYKMIKIDGGDRYGTYYMMQTELMNDTEFSIGSETFKKLDLNGDHAVTKGEFNFFLRTVREETGIPFRLPTENEWKYAANGGREKGPFEYSGSNDVDEVAWCLGNSSGAAHLPALKAPNELGLYDMSGNYWELCNNTVDLYYVDDLSCGGSFADPPSDCTVSSTQKGDAIGKIPGTSVKEENAFDAKYITVRLVYSVRDTSMD